MRVEKITMTANELSKYLGLSKDTIYQLARENKIPHVRVGRRILFKQTSLDEWLDEKENNKE